MRSSSATPSAARRSPSHPLRRYAARAGGHARRRAVYAAGFHTGNRTTTITESVVPNGGPAGGRRRYEPRRGSPQPQVGLIVKYDGSALGRRARRRWDAQVQLLAARPRRVRDRRHGATRRASSRAPAASSPASARSFQHGGQPGEREGLRHQHSRRATTCASRVPATSPARHRAAGTSPRAASPCSTRRARCTPRHLNKHIDYDDLLRPAPQRRERPRASRFPLGHGGDERRPTLYVAAFGSSEVGVFDTAALEADTFVADAATRSA